MVWLKNNRGLTLIEVLAAVALLSVILLLVGSLHVFGQKNFNDQAVQAENTAHLRLAMSWITKDVRRAEEVTYSSETNQLQMDNENITYSLTGDTLLRNNTQVIARNISTFAVHIEGDKVTINLESDESPTGRTIELSSEIFLRR